MLLFAALLLAVPHRVYTSNEASDDVAVIEDDALVARIPVGKRPRGLKLGPGGKLYVAVSGSPRGGPGQRDEDLPPADRAQDGIAVVDLASEKWSGGFRGARSRIVRPEPGRQAALRLQRGRRGPERGRHRSRQRGAHGEGRREPEASRSRPDGRRSTSQRGERRSGRDRRQELHPAGPAGGRRPPAGVAFTPDGARAFVSAERVRPST